MNTLHAPTDAARLPGAALGTLPAPLAAVLTGWILLLLTLMPSPTSAQAQRAASPVEGGVERVVDGDSLWFRPAAGEPIELRLKDIDAPELCQPGGETAREALREKVENRSLMLRVTGRDRFGRTLGTLHDGTHDIGTRMVAEGHAWSVRTRWDQGPLVAQERMARALRRGLHGDPSPVPPWDFRRAGGCGATDASAGRAPAAAGSVASATVAPPTAHTQAVAPARSASVEAGRGAAAGANPAGSTQPHPATPAARAPLLAERGVIALSAARSVADSSAQGGAGGTARFRCDGRRSCSEMRSCEEATFFLQHCPNVHMDGNRDGVPCERQWCGSRRR